MPPRHRAVLGNAPAAQPSDRSPGAKIGFGVVAALLVLIAIAVARIGHRPPPTKSLFEQEDMRSGVFDPRLVYVVSSEAITSLREPHDQVSSSFMGSSPVIRPTDGRILYLLGGANGVQVRQFIPAPSADAPRSMKQSSHDSVRRDDPVVVPDHEGGGPCLVDIQGLRVAPGDGSIILGCYATGWVTSSGRRVSTSSRHIVAVGREGALLAEKASHARLLIGGDGEEVPISGPPEYSNEDRGTVRSHEDGFWIASSGELWLVSPSRAPRKVGTYPISPTGFWPRPFDDDRALDARGGLYVVGELEADGDRRSVVVRFPLNAKIAEIAYEPRDLNSLALVTGP